MKAMFEKICVMGLGYIGLPAASLLVTKGYKVVDVDVSEVDHGLYKSLTAVKLKERLLIDARGISA